MRTYVKLRRMVSVTGNAAFVCLIPMSMGIQPLSECQCRRLFQTTALLSFLSVLFDLEKGRRVYMLEGVDAYYRYQVVHESDVMNTEIAFQLVWNLLSLNVSDTGFTRVGSTTTDTYINPPRQRWVTFEIVRQGLFA